MEKGKGAPGAPAAGARHRRRLPFGLLAGLVYALLALAWLARGLFFWGYDRGLAPLPLEMADARLVALGADDGAGEGRYVSESIDPQIVFDNVDTRARTLRLVVTFERAPGEMALYYTRGPGEEFSPRQRVFGRLEEDGSYLYALPPGRIAALRLDPGEQNENGIYIEEMLLNPARPAGSYFVPTARNVVEYLLWGALASCAIYTIIELVAAGLRRRAKKNEHPAASATK